MNTEAFPTDNQENDIFHDEDHDTVSLYGDDIVKLLLNGRIFTAHRKALSGKSPVFKKQLKKLKADEFLEIPNMEESIFEQLLSYVYRGTVDSVVLKEKAVQLWIAADKVTKTINKGLNAN